MKLKNLLKFAQDHQNDIETNCGACGLFFDDSQADKEGLHLPEFCDAVEFPSYEEMKKALEQTAPEGWAITNEYHFIGVNHPKLINEQFIAFGDVNKYYGFNDTNADTVCGDMRELTDPDEIAKSFWGQLKEFYPELFKEEVSTYHGLIKVSCILCEYETKSVSEMEMLNDMDGVCPKCENQFFRWENKDGSVVVSLTKDYDGLHSYENLTDTKGIK